MSFAIVRLYRLTCRYSYDNRYRTSLGSIDDFITSPKVRSRYKLLAFKTNRFLVQIADRMHASIVGFELRHHEHKATS